MYVFYGHFKAFRIFIYISTYYPILVYIMYWYESSYVYTFLSSVIQIFSFLKKDHPPLLPIHLMPLPIFCSIHPHTHPQINYPAHYPSWPDVLTYPHSTLLIYPWDMERYFFNSPWNDLYPHTKLIILFSYHLNQMTFFW